MCDATGSLTGHSMHVAWTELEQVLILLPMQVTCTGRIRNTAIQCVWIQNYIITLTNTGKTEWVYWPLVMPALKSWRSFHRISSESTFSFSRPHWTLQSSLTAAHQKVLLAFHVHAELIKFLDSSSPKSTFSFRYPVHPPPVSAVACKRLQSKVHSHATH